MDKLRTRARSVRRQARERRLTLPPVLVAVGTASSGRQEVVSLLGNAPGLRVGGSLEFLPGLCRWFPNMDRLVGSVLRPKANESAAFHVRRMLKDVLAAGGPGVPVLPLEASADAAGHLEAATIVPALLPEAVFLLVARHPFDEFADAAARRPGLAVDAFALEWAAAAREWLRVALDRAPGSFVLVRGARYAIHLQDFRPPQPLLLAARPRRTVPLAHWIAFRELGSSLAPVLDAIGVRDGARPPSPFADASPGGVGEDDRHRIVEVCGREMMAMRMLTASDFQDVVPYLDPRDQPELGTHERG